MLDSDIAELYGVETREINQAVKNNSNKFPDDFLFTLSGEEWESLRSKNLTLNEKKGRGQHRKYAPLAFTEQGVYMLATILKGDVAADVTISIMRTFAKMRKYLVEHTDLYRQIGEIKEEIAKNKEWTKEKLIATADAITILEEMILEVKAAKEIETIGFLRRQI